MPAIEPESADHHDMLVWRRDLHANPELGLEEADTSAFVQESLRSFGVDEVITGLAHTGVIGVIHGRAGLRRAIGLRADMDALPIHETTGLPYASRNDGIMHACGHDGHVAMLLGAARHLAATRRFSGTVYAIFQPAEEGRGGGALMIKDGLFERCHMEMVFGMHNWPQLPAGVFAWRNGPIMAGASRLKITITGKGGHGALPHLAKDPIGVACYTHSALQTIVGRVVGPGECGIVSICQLNSGLAVNVIPDQAVMRGTTRWSDVHVGNRIETEVRSLVAGVAAGYGVRAEVELEQVCPATINDPEATAFAASAAAAIAGERQVIALDSTVMCGEDFGYMLGAKPGSYILLGAARGPDSPGVHQSDFDFNDDILPIGASYWVALAERCLGS